ncbi:ABC1 kinase family protein [Isachenkonia alkalipeptolytica]|uniref:AarF/ABC1/UbiB kinase family protein n=1 Tax=Isachenkonia alkalipeptolytica TaxID=2565777 RepID=A0AA43XL97_9CLOT|nr:AarF/ABC1/UbiB kinase family protein [Isachenkonia alkalipeptolytica]NBG88915.1 AarF/ABC1/UbiB kinase family protein [Isachenkonia alkalipeptolytica]
MIINRKYGTIRRYKKIGEVLVKYGFTFLADSMRKKGYIPKRVLKIRKNNFQETWGVRIRKACEELGPTFVKLGQIMGTRRDIFSEDIIEELEKLQDQVEEFSFDEAREVFERNSEQSIDGTFHYFNKKPIASGSIGQVYEAVLTTGEEVVVKIQRPKLESIIKDDLEILITLAKIMDEHFYKNKSYSFQDIIEEFRFRIQRELDYTLEGKNAERFSTNFQSEEKLYIPKVHWEFSNKRVLTMEKIKGYKIIHKEILQNPIIDHHQLALDNTNLFLEQVFVYGFFHGDPHPGNIFITPEGKISYIDFGVVGFLDKDSINFITNLFIAVGKKDVDKIFNLIREINAINYDTNSHRLKEDISFFINEYYDKPIKELKLGVALRQFMDIAYNNGVKFPSQFILLLKAMISLESTVNQLSPRFSIAMVMKDFMKEIYKRKYHPERLAKEYFSYSQDVLFSLKYMPRQLKSILQKMEDEKFTVHVIDEESKEISREIQKQTRRVGNSIVVAALIIASTMILVSDYGTNLFSVPILSWFGFLLSGIYVLKQIFMNE